MVDTVRNGVMSATARMNLIFMIFLPHLLERTTGRLQVLLHRSSSKRRENASFLAFDENCLPCCTGERCVVFQRKPFYNQPFRWPFLGASGGGTRFAMRGAGLIRYCR